MMFNASHPLTADLWPRAVKRGSTAGMTQVERQRQWCKSLRVKQGARKEKGRLLRMQMPVKWQESGPGEEGQEAKMPRHRGKEDGIWDSSLKGWEPLNEFNIYL